jgi:RNA recognition motif. (a.k.a. RRM, RBD, or RNP domain)
LNDRPSEPDIFESDKIPVKVCDPPTTKMSDPLFWNWAAVTPLTVEPPNAILRSKNHRRTKPSHRRNDMVFLPKKTNDPTNHDAVTAFHHPTAVVMDEVVVELEYQNDQRCESRTSSRIPPPTYNFVWQGDDADADDDDDEIDELTGLRLSLAGLSSRSRACCSWSQSSSKSSDDHRDELHSHLYSSVLETIRTTLVNNCIPQITEEMISRAIIHAFADPSIERRNHDADDDDQDSETPLDDQHQYEVNVLCKAHDFMHGRLNQFGKRRKINDFLQSVLDEMFLKIRREEMTCPDDVLRTMLSVLSILQMKVDTTSVTLPMDTILLTGLTSQTSRTDLVQELSRFGPIKSVAIAQGSSSSSAGGFGYCCFVDEESVRTVLAPAAAATIVLHGVTPQVSLLQQQQHHGKHAHHHAGKVVASRVRRTNSNESSTPVRKAGRLLWSI